MSSQKHKNFLDLTILFPRLHGHKMKYWYFCLFGHLSHFSFASDSLHVVYQHFFNHCDFLSRNELQIIFSDKLRISSDPASLSLEVLYPRKKKCYNRIPPSMRNNFYLNVIFCKIIWCLNFLILYLCFS